MKRRSQPRLRRPRPAGVHRGKHRKKKSGPPPPSRFRFPCERDVVTFAAELGMDLEFDSEQRWLVDQALGSELPPLWTRVFNPTARAYYVRAPTKAEPKEIVTWVHPLVPAYSKIFDNILADQLEAQKAALGIVSDEEDDGDNGNGGDDFDPDVDLRGEGHTRHVGPKLSGAQRKKVRASQQDAMLFYKQLLGNPATEDVRPREDTPGFWNVEPDDVEDMAEFLGIDKDTQPHFMWIARIAACVPLPPGWSAHSDGDDVSNMCAESRMVSLDELGVVYTCKSWMCKTEAMAARMALDVHPSEAYIQMLLRELKEEYGDDDDLDDGFSMPPEVIPCEFATEDGKIYVYDFKDETSVSTGRRVKDEDDEDDEDEDGKDEGMEQNMKNGMNVTLETKASRVGGQHGNDAAVVAVSSSNALFAISAQAPTKEEAAEQQGGQQLGMAAQARAAISAPGAESATTAATTEEDQDRQKYAALLNPEIIDVPPPTPGMKLILRLVDEGGLTEKQVHDFAKHIGLDIHAKRDSNFLWMVEEALLEKMDETVAQGWVYRKDPDSKYHYFCNRSQMRPDLTKGMEATTGWDTQSQQNGGVGKSRGKTDDASMAAAAAAVTGEDISSQWKHPLSKKYKTLLATRRKELDEERRMKRVRGLRAKSSTLHCAKINQGRSAGRQAIVIDHDTGEPVPLQAPPRQANIRRPSNAAEEMIAGISPNKRAIPLQPGFIKEAQMRSRKKRLEDEARQAEGGGASGKHLEGVAGGGGVSELLSRMHGDLPMSPGFAPRGDSVVAQVGQVAGGGRIMPHVRVHPAFRDVALVDTSDAQRELEEARRVARRKRRINNKHKKKRKGLDNSNPAMICGSSTAFPPLKLDATSQLGVISLSRSTPTLLPSATMMEAPLIRQTSAHIPLQVPSSATDENNSDERRTNHGAPQTEYRHQEEGNHNVQTFDKQGGTSSPKKGLLSPSHQGRFAACGNLVPMSTVLWENAHDRLDVFGVGTRLGGNTRGTAEEDDVDRQIASFQREYDKAHAEDEDILDDWINKSTLDDVPERAGGDGVGNGSGSSSFSIGIGETSIEMSTSMSVVKNISLKPLPPRTPTTAGSVGSISSVGSLGIRGASAGGHSNYGRGISTPPSLTPLRERGVVPSSSLR